MRALKRSEGLVAPSLAKILLADPVLTVGVRVAVICVSTNDSDN